MTSSGDAVVTAFDECDHDLSLVERQCEDGTYCVSPDSERVQLLRDISPLAYESGACLPPVREGSLCDSNAIESSRANVIYSGAVAERPCEIGTYCLFLPYIYDDPDTLSEHRCVRPCENLSDPGEPSDECACNVSHCQESLSGELYVQDYGHVGPNFCSPCLSHGETCGDNPYECCDERESCQSVTEYRVEPGGLVSHWGSDVCCTPIDGEAEPGQCDPSEPLDRCCAGSYCNPVSTTCEECIRTLDPYEENQACCPGLQPRLDGAGVLRCQPCPTWGCSPEVFYANTSEGISSYALNSQSLPWPRIFDGVVSGDFDAPSTEVEMVYELHEDRRAFVFADRTTSAGFPEVSNYRPVPGLFAGLPPSGSGLQVQALEPHEWVGARVYDQGACSLRVSWGVLTQRLVAQLLSSIALEFPTATDIRHNFTYLTPVLKDGRGALRGAVEAADYVVIDTDFELETHTIIGFVAPRIKAVLRVELLQGYNEIGVGAVDDSVMAQVRCDQFPAFQRCWLPDREPDGSYSVYEEIFGPDPGGDFQVDDDDLHRVRCVPARDRYDCVLPGGGYGHITSVADEPSSRWPRRVDYVANSHDIGLVLESIDVDVDSAPGLVDDLLRDEIRAGVPQISSSLAAVISSLVGSHAEYDLGLDPAMFPACASDQDCRYASYADTGMRRNSCVNTSVGPRCAGLRVEPRRVNVRPDGLEIVLAEDRTTDGQQVLLEPMAAFAGDPLCYPGRYPVHDSESGMLINRELEASTVSSYLVCDSAAEGCDALCPGAGTTCLGAALTGLASAGSSCNAGSCCLPEEFCDGACRNLDFDNEHCGGCGAGCGLGTFCVGGSCVAP